MYQPQFIHTGADSLEELEDCSRQFVFPMGQALEIVKTVEGHILPKELCVSLYEGGYCYKHDEELTETVEGWTLEETCTVETTGEVYPEDMCIYLERYDCWELEDSDHVKYSELHEEYFYDRDVYWSEYHSSYIHSSESTYINSSNDYVILDYCDDVHYCERCDEYYIEGSECCSGSECPVEQWLYDSGFISEYDQKPHYFEATRKGDFEDILLGLEIELELNEESSDTVAYALWKVFKGKGWLSQDGSLNDGLELILLPHDIAALKELPFERLKDTDIRSYDTSTCGLHIHSSKISDEHTYFLCRFFAENREKLEHFSRRYGNTTYCKFYSTFDDYRYADKYSALFSRHRNNTNEFRLFRGTITKKALLRNIEFVHALNTFGAHQLFIENRHYDTCSASWGDFRNFVNKRASEYNNLANYERL